MMLKNKFPALRVPNYIVIRDNRVLDADKELFKMGLKLGDTKNEAKALLGQRVVWVEWNPEEYIALQSKWLNVLRYYTDEIEVTDQHLAFVGLTSHPQPQLIAKLISDHLKKLGFEHAMGIANTKWVARLACDLNADWHESYLTPRRFLDNLPIQSLPIQSETIKRLIWFGYSTIQDLRHVPLKVLCDQFGDEGYQIRQFCLGNGDRQISINFPQKAISSSFWLETPVINQSDLDYGFNILSGALSQIAIQRDECAHKLRLRLKFEQQADQLYDRIFTKPIQSARQFQYGFERLIPAPLPTGLIGIVGSGLDLKTMPRIQLSLKREIPQELRDAKNKLAVTHLQKTFGRQAIQIGESLNSRKKFLRMFKDAVGWK